MNLAQINGPDVLMFFKKTLEGFGVLKVSYKSDAMRIVQKMKEYESEGKTPGFLYIWDAVRCTLFVKSLDELEKACN